LINHIFGLDVYSQFVIYLLYLLYFFIQIATKEHNYLQLNILQEYKKDFILEGVFLLLQFIYTFSLKHYIFQYNKNRVCLTSPLYVFLYILFKKNLQLIYLFYILLRRYL